MLVANVGDAKAVLARETNQAMTPGSACASTPCVATAADGGDQSTAPRARSSQRGEPSPLLRGIILTKDHKAIYAPERRRIGEEGDSVYRFPYAYVWNDALFIFQPLHFFLKLIFFPCCQLCALTTRLRR